MRIPAVAKLAFFLFLPVPSNTLSQQLPSSQSVLAGAVSVLGMSNSAELSLSGNAESIAGSAFDSGSFTASCGIDGSSKLNLQFSGGSRTEARDNTNGLPSGTWVDSEGVSHAMSAHNLFAPAAWFCPGIFLARAVSDPSISIQFVGRAQKNGLSASHFVLSAIQPSGDSATDLYTQLTRVDLYLDSQTSRPIVLDFNLHPDGDAGEDIPIEIRFSNYTDISGMWIPCTVQKYVNSSLTLTLSVESAVQAANTVSN